MSWRIFFSRTGRDAELAQELESYLAEEIAENEARGMSAKEARRRAYVKMGNPQQVHESLWQQNTVMLVENLLRDLKYAARTLRRSPGFTLVAVLVIAIGIGANVALFTVVRSVLLRPLPFEAPDQLVAISERGTPEDSPDHPVAAGMFEEWQEQNRGYADLAILGGAEMNLSGLAGTGKDTAAELPEKVQGANSSWNLLRVLGVKPALGRDFNESDDRPSANGTVLLSWGLWKRRFAGDPAVLNRVVYLNARAYTVIGVLPAWFSYPDASTQLWTPIHHDKPTTLMQALSEHQFQAVGRLRPGVTVEQGQAELSLIVQRVHNQHRDDPFVSLGANVRPLLEKMVGAIKKPLYMLLAATGCVLLIACLNVANLLVARSAARKRELAIRSALGGARLRLLRERLMESFLLAALGGAGGLILAFIAVAWLASARQDMARVEAIQFDWVVAAFTVALIALCAVFAGFTSSGDIRNSKLLNALQEASRGSSASRQGATLRRTLLTLEVGLTVVLLVAAGLLMKSYQRLRSADMGSLTENVLTMRISPFGARYRQPEQLANFYQQLLARVRAVPGVKAAAFTDAVPGQGYWEDMGFNIIEHPALPQGKGLYAINRWVDPGYFAAIGIPLLRGHGFDPSKRLDRADEALVSKLFADRYFPGEDPIGKHLRIHDGFLFTIVGIVGDTRFSVAEQPQPMQYFPLYTGHANRGTIVVRSSRNVESLALPVQRIVQDLDRDLPVSDVLTMDQLIGKSTLDQSFNAALLVAFATLSLVLAGVGLFGVLTYIVTQRRSEIGIRIALGAQREQIVRLMMADGMKPAILGLLLGLVASGMIARLISSMLYKTEPLDPVVFVAVSGSMLMIAGLACLLPAWQASRVDPIETLKTM